MIRIDLSLRNLLAIVGVLLGLWLVTKLWSVLLLAGVGLLFAAALMPYVDWLWRRTHNRAIAVLAVLGTVLAVFATITLLVTPSLIAQGRQIWEEYPEYQARAARFADERGWVEVRDQIQAFEPGEAAGPHLVDTGRALLGGIIALFTIVFLAAYFLLDARRLKQFLYFATPRPWHPHIKALLPALQRVVGGYMRAQLVTSGAIGLFSFVLLTVLDVPNATALAAIAAVADLIPLIGVYILLVPMLFAALSVSPTTAAIAGGAMVLYQQFEDRVLVPKVYGATLRLPTIAVVLAILAGGALLGFTGALLALPVAAGTRVVVEYFTTVRTESSAAAEAGVAPSDEVFAPDDAEVRTAATGGEQWRTVIET